MLHARVQYDIFDWLNIAGRVRLDKTHSTEERKLHASTLELYTGSSKGSYTNKEEFYTQTYADVMANINKRFGTDFSLTANVGGSFEDHYTRSIDVGGKLMTVPNLFSLANVEPASVKETRIPAYTQRCLLCQCGARLEKHALFVCYRTLRLGLSIGQQWRYSLHLLPIHRSVRYH